MNWKTSLITIIAVAIITISFISFTPEPTGKISFDHTYSGGLKDFNLDYDQEKSAAAIENFQQELLEADIKEDVIEDLKYYIDTEIEDQMNTLSTQLLNAIQTELNNINISQPAQNQRLSCEVIDAPAQVTSSRQVCQDQGKVCVAAATEEQSSYYAGTNCQRLVDSSITTYIRDCSQQIQTNTIECREHPQGSGFSRRVNHFDSVICCNLV